MQAHNHTHEHHSSGTNNIRFAFLVNVTFTIIEIIGGFLTNSIAIISDALHDLGDSFSLALSWYLSKVSEKKRTSTFTYGYKRFSMLAALVNGMILLAGSLFVLSEAVPRLFKPELANARGMFLFAILGVTVNGIAAFRVRSGKTINERMVTLHLLEDVLGWAAILVISVIMMVRHVPVLDPVLAVLITVYILWNVVRNLKGSMMIFLQGVPEKIKMEELERGITDIDGVKDVHHTHIWSLDGANHILSCDVVVKRETGREEIMKIKSRAKQIAGDFGVDHATIEIEFEDEHCDEKK
jgi:cobalt-zinc-cadmium efflux system protein